LLDPSSVHDVLTATNNDLKYVERAEIIRKKGTNRSRFFRGQAGKCTWVGIGSSYLPSDILAAFLYAQLEAREQIQKKRRRKSYGLCLESSSTRLDQLSAPFLGQDSAFRL